MPDDAIATLIELAMSVSNPHSFFEASSYVEQIAKAAPVIDDAFHLARNISDSKDDFPFLFNVLDMSKVLFTRSLCRYRELEIAGLSTGELSGLSRTVEQMLGGVSIENSASGCAVGTAPPRPHFRPGFSRLEPTSQKLN